MSRKATPILFIIFANILLLVNVVAPYNTNRCRFCKSKQRSSIVCEVSGFSHSGCSHANGCNSCHKGCKCCFINHNAVLPSDSQNYFAFGGFLVALIDTRPYTFQRIDCTNALFPPLIASSYFRILNNSLGLRAPPVA